jgi:hypothetical protein
MPLSESRFRQILREEARRVIREDKDTVGLADVRKAHNAKFTEIIGDRILTRVGGRSDFSDYEGYYIRIVQVVDKVTAALPDTSRAKGKMQSGFTSFTKQGSRSPFVKKLLEIRNSKLAADYKARAILAVFGGYDGTLAGSGSGGIPYDGYLGINESGMPFTGGVTRADVNRLIITVFVEGHAGFVEAVLAMAAFDVVGETQRVLAQETPQPTTPPAPAPTTPPAPAPAPPKPKVTWEKYIQKVPNGQQVKNAWDRYALATVPPLNPNDYSLFKKWWDSYKAANPGWGGSPVETVAALAKATVQRRKQPLPGM